MRLFASVGRLYRQREHAHRYECIHPLLNAHSLPHTNFTPGESVPVSKYSLTDEGLKYLDLSAPSVHPIVARHFLFSGTKIIRARRPHDVNDDEAVALAIVVRTGFLTTKGALVRSMLFPKPSGFKFYRDSFRYISVMGLIAVLGFVASFVNFVRLGVSLPEGAYGQILMKNSYHGTSS